jgi:type I restriction enzyme, S subunit
MNAERLLALYEKVAEAPDAIVRLRRFVLDLAVRGKLVVQEPTDDPASELLKRITMEKARLMKGGAIRKSRKDADLSADDPYELPEEWLWVPFGELHHLVRGVTYSKGDVSETPSVGFVPILRANNIGQTLTHDDPVYVKAERVSSDQYLRRGDYMIALSSGSKNLVGKAALVHYDLDYGFGGFCGAVRPFDPALVGFFGVFLSSDLYRESISAGSRGIGINNLKKEVLANLHFPLPPIAEQRRIVAKVEELMALLDRLEAARTAREATRDRLSAASLACLVAPDTTPEVFPAHARFALDALPALTTRRDQIKALRQTILNLAVRGMLVEQDPNNEPANSELEKVVKLKSEHNLRKVKKVARVQDAEKWCLTPLGWEWTRWDEITNWITYGFTRPMEHIDYGVPIITGKNVNEDQIIFETASLTAQESFDALNEKDKPQSGDILITKDGSIGRTAIVEEKHLPFCINQSVAVMWLRSCHFDRRYLKLVLDSPQTQNALLEKTAGVAIKHISITDLGKMMFPFPPLAEQRRIVGKVDALIALCDQMETALDAADADRTSLLEALLHEALEPTLKEAV